MKPLIEIGMSTDGPQMYHNEKRCMHTVEQVQSESGLVHRLTEAGAEPSLPLVDLKRETIIISSTLDMTEESQRFPDSRTGRIFTGFNNRHFVG